MSNCVESIEVMYAIWHAGLCAVPMNAKLHAREFAFILENSGARLCFVTPDLAATIAEAAKEAPELKEIVDVTTRSYTFMEVGDPSRHDRGGADRSRPGCSTPRAPPAGPRAPCSRIAICWR